MDNSAPNASSSAGGTGGAMYCRYGASPTLVNCTFTGNWARIGGGAMYNANGNPSFNDCAFTGNWATGTAAYAGSGAIDNNEGSMTLVNCTFTGNAGNLGGAIGNYQGGNAMLLSCTFLGNSATWPAFLTGGGAVCNVYYGTATLANCAFVGNTALGPGGAVYNYNHGDAVIVNCTFIHNRSIRYGGGVGCSSDSSATMANCILWNNIPDEVGCAANTTYSNIRGGWPGEGNIDVDPKFAFADDWHLMPDSPCIDAGTDSPPGGLPEDDLDGNPRPLDGDGVPGAVADMGALEFDPNSPTIALSPYSLELTVSEEGPSFAFEWLSIRNCGGEGTTLAWQLAEECSWLEVGVSSGVSEGEVDDVLVAAYAEGLSAGDYTSELTVAGTEATNSPRTVPVTLHVHRVLYVPAEHGTIQAAIDAAADHDVIVVADGTYTGPGNKDLDFGRKKITVRSENGPTGCIIDCENAGRGFYFHSGETETSVVEGFTITNGGASDDGAVCCENSGPIIRDCVITNSTGGVGGGIYCNGSTSLISQCTISGNVAHGYGGGVFCRESNVTMDSCTITANTSDHGAGLYCYYSNVRVTGCAITDNAASEVGGGLGCYRGKTTVIDSTIAANAANYDGGGIHCEKSELVLDGCMVRENVAGDEGGGLWCERPDRPPTVSGCTITRNSAGGPGGGIYCCDGDPVVTSCAITWNTTGSRGGGIYSWDIPTIVNCTIAKNRAADEGGGIYGGTPTVHNCIVWGNIPQEIDGADPLVTYSDIQGGWEGEGNMDLDPLLTRDGNHLQATSPCINAGDPGGDYTGQTDVDREPRLMWGRVDMGADELEDSDGDELPDWWEQLYFGSPVAADPSADPDGDRRVNLMEYALSSNPLLPPTTYYVDVLGDDAWDGLAPEWDGEHGPKATIQAAVDATELHEGDIVVVAEGTYVATDGFSMVNSEGKSATVRSTDPNDPAVVAATIIDCQGSASERRRAFGFTSGEGPDSVVAGFTIRNGYGRRGGAIFCSNHSGPTIARCTIVDCVAERYGGGLFCCESTPKLLGCTFIGNTAAEAGGAVYCEQASSATIADCIVVGNSSENSHGGGIYCRESYPRISRCTVVGNSAAFHGGGVRLYGCRGDETHDDPTITHCVITGNVADARGGGIACEGSSPIVTSCIISANAAQAGGGVHSSSDVDPRHPAMANCIVWGNTPGAIAVVDSTPLITFCDVEGGWPGAGNIDAEPQFVDPDGPDDDPNTWEDNDYQLAPESPCIDAGDNTAVPADLADLDDDGDTAERTPVDLDDFPRFVDRPGTDDTGIPDLPDYPHVVDMGAHEFGTWCDLDGDCDVDQDDLLILLDNYAGTSGVAYSDGDLDDDGDIDLSDLAELLGVYGTVCP